MSREKNIAAATIRDARKAKLSDAGSLDVFMSKRRACLAEGCSVLEANEQAHAAVSERERMGV